MAEPVQLASLGIQELSEVRQSLQQEIQGLAENALALQEAAAKFATTGQSIEHLQEQGQGQSLLLPLTESLYVGGQLESVESVLLDIGTGYFVEKDVAGGIDYCKRKVLMVRDKTEEVSRVIRQRQQMLQQVEMVLEQKMQAAAAAQQQQQKGVA